MYRWMKITFKNNIPEMLGTCISGGASRRPGTVAEVHGIAREERGEGGARREERDTHKV